MGTALAVNSFIVEKVSLASAAYLIVKKEQLIESIRLFFSNDLICFRSKMHCAAKAYQISYILLVTRLTLH
jgi:hypothetical protein